MTPAPLKASVRPEPVKVMSLLIVKVPLAVIVRLAVPVAAPVSVMALPVIVREPGEGDGAAGERDVAARRCGAVNRYAARDCQRADRPDSEVGCITVASETPHPY